MICYTVRVIFRNGKERFFHNVQKFQLDGQLSAFLIDFESGYRAMLPTDCVACIGRADDLHGGHKPNA